MKRFSLLILIIFTTLISCNKAPNQSVVTSDGDTIASRYVVAERRVGEITRGINSSRLTKRYGESYVKQLRSPDQSKLPDSLNQKVFYVYSPNNHLEMIATTKAGSGEDLIDNIIIKDNRFTTAKGINLSSTFGEVVDAYPDGVVVQSNGNFFIFISSLDLYLGVAERDIEDYNPEFVADIPLGSIKRTAKPNTMIVSWFSHEVGVLTPIFWEDILSHIIRWLITELPIIILIILLFVAVRRLIRVVVRKINYVATKRVDDDGSIDSHEALKRLETITGIVHGVLEIVIWSVFILVLLSKFHINIAPILASAGILGLAVGFGAQELVRDFISGFFILLEDQLRTGDMAIINGTTGVVEKIELRTVTLRDTSGVVHIFQNGKINSLSNMTKEWSAIVLEIGVAYKEDVDRVMKIMKSVGDQMRKTPEFGALILEDVDIWGLDSFGDSAIIIKMSIKTRPMQQWRVKREYQRLLKIRFDHEGIEIPFPHLSIYAGEASGPIAVEMVESEAEKR